MNEIIFFTQDQINEMEIQNQINDLKAKLRATDYQAIKYAEGRLTQEEYQPIGEQRQQWRDKINDLEKKGVKW